MLSSAARIRGKSSPCSTGASQKSNLSRPQELETRGDMSEKRINQKKGPPLNEVASTYSQASVLIWAEVIWAEAPAYTNHIIRRTSWGHTLMQLWQWVLQKVNVIQYNTKQKIRDLHVGYVRQEYRHTWYLLLFHSHNGYANAPPCYIIRVLWFLHTFSGVCVVFRCVGGLEAELSWNASARF